MVGMSRIELPTYPLSGDCSTTELHANELVPLERIELPSEDYKAPVLPLYYSGVIGGGVSFLNTLYLSPSPYVRHPHCQEVGCYWWAGAVTIHSLKDGFYRPTAETISFTCPKLAAPHVLVRMSSNISSTNPDNVIQSRATGVSGVSS